MNATTLDTVIREMLIQEGKDSLHDYKRYEQYAVTILRDLYYNVDGVPRLVELTINDNGVADLPEDFVKEVKVGYIDGNNEFRLLTPNNSIGIHKNVDKDCQVQDSLMGGLFGTYLYTYPTAHIVNGQVVGRFYGIGGRNTYGEYRIDHLHNIITFNSGIAYTYVSMEYIGSFEGIDGDFIIDPRAIEVIKKGIYMSKVAFKRSVPRGEKDVARRDYEVAKTNYAIMVKMPRIQDILAASRKNFKSAPKI